jgi:hypothetical protein
LDGRGEMSRRESVDKQAEGVTRDKQQEWVAKMQSSPYSPTAEVSDFQKHVPSPATSMTHHNLPL